MSPRQIRRTGSTPARACGDSRKTAQLVHHGRQGPDRVGPGGVLGSTTGDRRAFSRKGGDISLLEAVTLAAWKAGERTASVYESRGALTL
jgi:hypothetical protein